MVVVLEDDEEDDDKLRAKYIILDIIDPVNVDGSTSSFPFLIVPSFDFTMVFLDLFCKVERMYQQTTISERWRRMEYRAIPMMRMMIW